MPEHYQLFCYEDSVRVIWEDSKLEAIIPDLKPGQEFTNSELCQYFGCSTQGGMRRSLPTSSHQYQRNPYIVEQARRRADGLCQLCDQPAPFKDKKGTPFLEVHHVQ